MQAFLSNISLVVKKERNMRVEPELQDCLGVDRTVQMRGGIQSEGLQALHLKTMLEILYEMRY